MDANGHAHARTPAGATAWRARGGLRAQRSRAASGDLEVAHRIARAVGGLVDLDLVFRTAVDALQAPYLYSPDVVRELSAQERTERLERAQALAALRAVLAAGGRGRPRAPA